MEKDEEKPFLENDEEEPFLENDEELTVWENILAWLMLFALICVLISPFYLWGLYKEYKAHNSNCNDCFTYCDALSHKQEYREKREEVLLSIRSAIRKRLRDDERSAWLSNYKTMDCKDECWKTYGEEVCSEYGLENPMTRFDERLWEEFEKKAPRVWSRKPNQKDEPQDGGENMVD